MSSSLRMYREQTAERYLTYRQYSVCIACPSPPAIRRTSVSSLSVPLRTISSVMLFSIRMMTRTSRPKSAPSSSEELLFGYVYFTVTETVPVRLSLSVTVTVVVPAFTPLIVIFPSSTVAVAMSVSFTVAV